MLLGVSLISLRIVELIRSNYVNGEVVAVEQYAGDCRRPSGRTQSCNRYQATVRFNTTGTSAPVEVQIEAGQRSMHLEKGAHVMLMYAEGAPTSAHIASLSEGWRSGLSLLMAGILITLITRANFSRSQELPPPRLT